MTGKHVFFSFYKHKEGGGREQLLWVFNDITRKELFYLIFKCFLSSSIISTQFFLPVFVFNMHTLKSSLAHESSKFIQEGEMMKCDFSFVVLQYV